jgi:glycolate oxidase FAD binding subunit
MAVDVTAGITVDGARIENLVEPESIEEARDIIRQAHVDGRHVLITAGQTRLAFGNLGGPFDQVISTRKLSRVVAYEPDDMTMAVEPGCTIAQLRDLLHANNQMIALDTAHEERATIGGSYATGLSGPRRLAGGSLKDWVIGVEVIGADGALAKAGGMVVKNVTGFDMMHVHYAALGSFGLVSRINLKVFPRPSSSRALRLRFTSPDDAYAAAIDLLRSQLQPSSVIVTNTSGWCVVVRCDAPDSAIERLVERIRETASMLRQPSDSSVSEDADAALQDFRTVTDLTRQRGVVRLSIPASRQLPALRALDALDGQQVCADLGSGLIYVAATASQEWMDALDRIGTTLSYLALPAELKRGVDVFGAVGIPSATIIRRMKSTFDPGGTFNRGRFVLGL